MRTTMEISPVTARLAGDARLMNGAGYALMLQVAHPVVGAGVAQFSNFQEDPWGRLVRTLDYVNVTIFGGPEAAAAMGARTRAMHKQIKGFLPNGERYHSLEPGAFAWVHATLGWSMIRSNELFVGPVSAAARETFYADWRRLGHHIGVRDRDLPQTWPAFARYIARTEAEVLEDTESVRTVLKALAHPARPAVRGLNDPLWTAIAWPAAKTARLALLGMLGSRMRATLGLQDEWTRPAQAAFRAFAAAQRTVTPVAPRAAKDFGRQWLRWRHDALVAQGLPLGDGAAARPAVAAAA